MMVPQVSHEKEKFFLRWKIEGQEYFFNPSRHWLNIYRHTHTNDALQLPKQKNMEYNIFRNGLVVFSSEHLVCGMYFHVL